MNYEEGRGGSRRTPRLHFFSSLSCSFVANRSVGAAHPMALRVDTQVHPYGLSRYSNLITRSSAKVFWKEREETLFFQKRFPRKTESHQE